MLIYYLSNIILKRTVFRITNELRYEFVKKINSIKISSLDKYSGGDITSRIINDIDFINDGYSIGRYYGQCPTIDSIIIINKILNVGQTYNVRITEKLDYDLKGELTYDECTK